MTGSEDFTRGLRKAEFFIIVGEAAKRLSPDFKGAHPEIHWKSIAGLRDVLVR
jgi:uncharacterized protein with HEPN domain